MEMSCLFYFNNAPLTSPVYLLDGVRPAHPEAHANTSVDIEGFSDAAGGQVGFVLNQYLRTCDSFFA